jgi:hypothetical protein
MVIQLTNDIAHTSSEQSDSEPETELKCYLQVQRHVPYLGVMLKKCML